MLSPTDSLGTTITHGEKRNGESSNALRDANRLRGPSRRSRRFCTVERRLAIRIRPPLVELEVQQYAGAPISDLNCSLGRATCQKKRIYSQRFELSGLWNDETVSPGAGRAFHNTVTVITICTLSHVAAFRSGQRRSAVRTV